MTVRELAVRWGRNTTPSNLTVLLSTCIMVISPLFVILAWNICHRYRGDIPSELVAKSFSLWLPQMSTKSLMLLVGWLILQFLLYIWLPGSIAEGQETPAGHVLKYKINGLLVWTLSNFGLAFLSLGLEIFPLSIIADNWEGLLVAANIYGFSLAVVSYIKAHIAPSHPKDCKFTDSKLYDLFMGIELNPRFGDVFDFKLFHNGRPGIVAWTMINLSFAAAQYNRFGLVSDSMILVNILQALYVIDFFVHEDWYLKTIDISHDHFGFMLAWGDSVWLPFMYTLQAQYLSYHPIRLGGFFWTILGMGIIGYCIFREANFQKDICRSTDGKCFIWGKPVTVIRAVYTSSNGKLRDSLLLTSGFWGIARHCNYTGDLILSTAMCLACGFRHLLPYFYVIFMGILLIHRVERDNARCAGKYGKDWDEYCRLVPYKLIPGFY